MRVLRRQWIGIEAAFGRQHLDRIENFERSRAALRQEGAWRSSVSRSIGRSCRRVERHHRFLKNHRHGRPPQGGELPFVERENVLIADPDLPVDDRLLLAQKALDRAHCHRLAGAGFTDDAKNFPRHKTESPFTARTSRRDSQIGGEGRRRDKVRRYAVDAAVIAMGAASGRNCCVRKSWRAASSDRPTLLPRSAGPGRQRCHRDRRVRVQKVTCLAG